MKKVITINVAGRAFQVEEAGHAALEAYLDNAARTLRGNPDATDILQDIEQAIADKCAAQLTPGKDVVLATEIDTILATVGPVEAAETDETPSTPASGTGRKLYLLPKEGKVAGVCAGLAAYFGIKDVTLVRLLFVILIFLTQGVMVLLYLALAIVLPAAKTPEEIASAYGRPLTARDIMSQVNVKPPSDQTLERIGVVVTTILRAMCVVLAIGAVMVLVALTAAWAWALWSVSFGSFALTGDLASLNGWEQIIIATALYLLFAVPVYWVTRLLSAVAKGPLDSPTPRFVRTADVSFGVLWAIALAALIGFALTFAPTAARTVRNDGGYLNIGDHHYCIDRSLCDPTFDR